VNKADIVDARSTEGGSDPLCLCLCLCVRRLITCAVCHVSTRVYHVHMRCLSKGPASYGSSDRHHRLTRPARQLGGYRRARTVRTEPRVALHSYRAAESETAHAAAGGGATFSARRARGWECWARMAWHGAPHGRTGVVLDAARMGARRRNHGQAGSRSRAVACAERPPIGWGPAGTEPCGGGDGFGWLHPGQDFAVIRV
jgi:hypothetical protein